jgi:hypothetical protein
MAKKTVSQYYSDMSGDEIESVSPTVHFAFEGVSYEIDLTDDEKATLRDVLGPYMALGRRTGATRGSRAPRSTAPKGDGPAPQEVRAWARDNDVEVPSRGRIPAAVVEAYREAH